MKMHYGILTNSEARVHCVFCGVYITKANKYIEQHTNELEHKENIDLMTNNAIFFNDDALFCKPCNIPLSEDESVTAHIGSDDHTNWYAAMEYLINGEFINIDAFLSCEQDDVFCEVCDFNINGTLKDIEKHVNSFNHRTKLAEKLKPLNGMFTADNEDEVWCKVCDEYIDNTIPEILEHIDEDQQHMDWFLEIEDLIEGHDISIDNYLANEFENHAYCNRCNIEITCSIHSIELHVNSEFHLNQV